MRIFLSNLSAKVKCSAASQTGTLLNTIEVLIVFTLPVTAFVSYISILPSPS